MKISTSKVRSYMAVMAASMLTVCNMLAAGPVTAFAASSRYDVSGDYSGGAITVSEESITLTQSDIKDKLHVVVRFLNADGAATPISISTGRGVDGSLKMSQVSVFDAKNWNTYIKNVDSASQEEALTAYPDITINQSEFDSVVGTTKRITKNITVAAFNTDGGLYGTFNLPLLCELEESTETVINGLSFETIVTRVNALNDAVENLDGSDYGASYEGVIANVQTVLESLKLSKAEIDADDLEGAITSVDTKIESIDNKIAEKQEVLDDEEASDEDKQDAEAEIVILSADKAELEGIRDNLIALQDTVLELAKSDGSVQDAVNSLKEEYNTLYEELDYLRTISASNNAGYAGVKDGQTVVFINGTAFPYDQASGTEYKYTDDNGDAHSVVKYTGTSEDGETTFDFFVTLKGVHVIRSDGSIIVYEDTLESTIFKVDNMLKSISNNLLKKQAELDDFYDAIKELTGEDYEGTTDSEKLSQIKTYVQDLLKDYNTNKKSYVSLVQALKGNLTEEEVLALKDSDIEATIDELVKRAQNVQDAIQKTLTGTTVTDLNRSTLENLQKSIEEMKENLKTSKTELAALVDALEAEDAAEALKLVKDMIKQVETLESENKTLTTSNASLEKQLETAKKNSSTTSSSTSSALKTLQDKVNSLTSSNSSLKSQLATATTTATNAANAAKNTSTTSTASNSTTVKALQDKVSDLTAQLAKKNTTTGSTTSSTSAAKTGTTTSSDTATRATVDTTNKTETIKDTTAITATSTERAEVNPKDTPVVDGSFYLGNEGSLDTDTDDDAAGDTDAPKSADDSSEEDRAEGGLPLKAIIFLVILAVLILGGGGFLIYKLFLQKPKPAVDVDALLEDDDFADEAGFDSEDSDDGAEMDMSDDIEIDDSEEDFAVE